MEWKAKNKDYIENIESAERRFVSHPVEYREDEDGKISGIASRVNDWYDLGLFEERVKPGAFEKVIKDDVRALFNHDPNLVLARTKSGTLDLRIDKDGNLSYAFKTPNRSYATDLQDAVKTGDVDQSSFAFRVSEDKWEWPEDDDQLSKPRRTITKFEKLYDVSPVTYPASPSTTVAARKLNDHKKEIDQAKIDKDKERIELEKRKLKFK